jgi:hypothetical protein
MRGNLFWLSDEQWARIEPHLPTDVRGVERGGRKIRLCAVRVEGATGRFMHSQMLKGD